MAEQPRPTTTTIPLGYNVAILVLMKICSNGSQRFHCQTAGIQPHLSRVIFTGYRAERAVAQTREGSSCICILPAPSNDLGQANRLDTLAR